MSRGAFLGNMGDLFEFVHYKGGVGVKDSRDVAFKSTLGGGRKAFLAPQRGLREWSVSTSGLDSEQFARFELLVAGAYGSGPFVFVEPLAHASNVLSPRVSVPGFGNEFAFTGGSAGSASVPGVGSVPVVLAASGNVDVAVGTPVVPGLPVTGSVFVQGSAAGTVTLKFLNSVGTLTHSKQVSATFGSWTRVSVSDAAVVGDHTARITVNSGAQFQVALPAVTWTSAVAPWSRGRGCYKAVVHGVSEDVLNTSTRRADFSFTVTEVGSGA